MYLPSEKINEKHYNSHLCKQLNKTKENTKLQNQYEIATEEDFSINGKVMEKVKEFKYLGRILEDSNNNWMTIKANLSKAKSRWAQVKRVLIRDNAPPRTMDYFYKAICQSVLLYGAETWV